MINAWKRLALLFLVLLSAGPNVALSDHIYPRNLSANGPWKTNLQHITAGVRGDLQVSDRNRRLAVDQAGVPALIEMNGVVRAYFQWAPTADDTIQFFDHIAYSDFDNGRWSAPQIISIDYERGRAHKYPFDPTVVALPEGGYRLYFTRNQSRRAGPSNKMTLGSAYSADGVTFSTEPGDRLKLDDRRINDCAVIFFDGKWHLISPNHDKMGEGYYAISDDGLTFERQDDLFMSGGAWLGNMVEHDGAVYFFGTGFTLKTRDFKTWEKVQRNRMADPGVAISGGKLHILSVGM